MLGMSGADELAAQLHEVGIVGLLLHCEVEFLLELEELELAGSW